MGGRIEGIIQGIRYGLLVNSAVWEGYKIEVQKKCFRREGGGYHHKHMGNKEVRKILICGNSCILDVIDMYSDSMD